MGAETRVKLMDKLANRLREDADKIEVSVSEELDHRIAASLQGVTQEGVAGKPRERSRPSGFWWASSLTGIAAAAAVIVIINLQQAEEPPQATPTDVVAVVPVIDWQAETAALTGPLQQELENLQADIRKAEEKVKKDIGL